MNTSLMNKLNAKKYVQVCKLYQFNIKAIYLVTYYMYIF